MPLSHAPYISADVLSPWHQGKVRESYLSSQGAYLAQVATDRVSTHNVVHESTVPDKGEVLTMLTIHWLTTVLKDLPHALVAYGRSIYRHLPAGVEEAYPDLHYRTLVMRKLNMVPVEFIYRRYLTGSLYKAYVAGEDPYGLSLPSGLVKMSRFRHLLFTPTNKSQTDKPVVAEVIATVYSDEHTLCRRAFLAVEEFLASLGIALVDSKMEVGLDPNGHLKLADELCTPDSSRFTRADKIIEGRDAPWIDKQILRDAAERTWGTGPKGALTFSSSIVNETGLAYQDLLRWVTGRTHSYWRAYLDTI